MLYLAKSTNFIVGPIAELLGWIMDMLFKFTSLFGVQNVGLSIILFTIATKLLMMPLTIKQQKFSKMSSIMNPELQAIAEKYRNKRDNDSILKMQKEQRAVFEKYGTSQSAGCLQMLIQFPIIFALYAVVRNIPLYVSSVKEYFTNIIMFGKPGGLHESLAKITEYKNSGKEISSGIEKLSTLNNENQIIDVLNQFGTSQWEELKTIFDGTHLEEIIITNSDKILDMNNFFGISLADKPNPMTIAVIIPILTGLSQWLSTKLMMLYNEKQQAKVRGKVKQPQNNTMATLNVIMPIMTGILALQLPSALGVYWIAQAIVTIVIQLGINAYLDSQDINDIVAKNIEKINRKRERQGLPPKNISANANIHTNIVKQPTKKEIEAKEEAIQNQIKNSTEYYKDSNKGSIASKAAMVKKYNEKHNK